MAISSPAPAADAEEAQVPTLLNGSAPNYFRPYSTNTIQVGFLTSLPTYQAETMKTFALPGAKEGGPKFRPLDPGQQVRIKLAFKEYEKFANVTFDFTPTPSAGAIRLGIAETRNAKSSLREQTGGVLIFAGEDRQLPLVNDIFIAPTTIDPDPALSFGEYGYTTVLHEVGHALGLKHPNEASTASSTNLSRAVSVMSYADWKNPDGTFAQSGYGMTPLLLDIAAVQRLWGTRAWNTEDTRYAFKAAPSVTENTDTVIYRAQIKAIWDTGGTDTLDATEHTGDVSIDLRPGYLSSIGGNKNIAVAFGTEIENAWGGGGDDRLTGNDLVNQLEGRNGNDTLEGCKGDDTLAGGEGQDTYVYNTGDGADTLFDEGRNRILYNGELVAGAFVYDNGGYRWASDNGKTITFSSPGKLVLDAGTSITFQNQATAEALDGTFGLLLRKNTELPTTFDRVIMGDLKVNPDGGVDDLGNPVSTGEPEPGRYDFLMDSAGNDKIDAGAGTDWISADRGGNDFLIGGEGDDIVSGRNGDDIITGNAGMDLLRGDEGKDEIYADGVVSIQDAIVALNGPPSGLKGDFIDGSEGDDLIVGGAGNDALNGGDQEDLIIGGAGDDEIDGDLKSSVVVFDWSLVRSVTTDANGSTSYFTQYNNVDFVNPTMGAADVIYGGAGADWVRAGFGDDYVEGGAGEDVLFGLEQSDDLIGGSERDVLVGDGIADVAAQGDDYLDGDTGDDELYGSGGSDQLFGGDGDDLLSSDGRAVGAGNDYLDGGEGADRLFGGARDDRLFGGAGADILAGDSGTRDGDGADFLDGGEGNDVMLGEGGADELRGGGGADQIAGDHGGADASGEGDVILGGAGDDILLGQGGDDQIEGGGDRDLVDGGLGNDMLAGGDGDDQLQGGDGSDALDGDLGADVLFGEAGDDNLSGGDAGDFLLGGLGNDVIDGGWGDDVFYYSLGEGSDSISDEGGFDWLVFTDLNLGDVSLGLGSLKIVVPGGEIHLTDFDADNPFAGGGIDYFQFADGTVMSQGELISTLGIQLATATPEADLLEGTFAAETFHALAGDDVVIARGGDDALFGEEGNDQLDAGSGNDYLSGGAGNDVLVGGAGIDTLEGGADDDSYVFRGGEGFDTAIDTQGLNHVLVAGGLGADDVRFGRQGIDLTVSTLDGLSRLTVKDWFAAQAFVDVHFEDGTVLDRAAVEAALPSNQVPIAVNDPAAVSEDGVVIVSGNALANDVDPEGRALRVTDPGATSTAFGSFSIDASGAYSYQLFNDTTGVQSLAQGETRTETFAYTVSDDDLGGAATAQGAVIVTVGGTNDLPVLGADNAATAEDAGAITGNVLANDSDIDAGSTLRVAQPDTQAGAYGTLQLDVQGAWSYGLANGTTAVQQLAAGQVAQDSFAFAVTDGIAQVGGTLNVQVAGRNDAPVLATPLADQAAAANTAWTWQLPAGSFTDVDTGDTLGYSATLADGTALPSWLTFDAATQTFSGRVPKTATGSLSIEVTAADGAGAQAADVFDLVFAAGGGGGGGGGSQGNEGVGNGVDGPPPGHGDGDFNDGPGTAPGSPGAQGGQGYRPPRREELAILEMSIEAPAAPREAPTFGRGKSGQAHSRAPGQVAHAMEEGDPAHAKAELAVQAADDLSIDVGKGAAEAAAGQGAAPQARWLPGEAWAEFARSAPSDTTHDAAIFARWRAIEDATAQGADPLALLAEWGAASEGLRLRLAMGGNTGLGAEGLLAYQSGTALEHFKGLGNGVAPLA